MLMDDQEQETIIGVETEIDNPIINCFNTASGDIVYIANNDDSLDLITADARASNLGFYYVLALDTPEKQEESPKMTLWKVNDSIVSQSFVPADPSVLNLVKTQNCAWFKLAKIPWELLSKVEAFFRKIDKDLNGSEAIVILGFDERFDTTDPDGWMVIVPKQTNSAAHCNYDPTSINDFIADEDIDFVRQVGTIHSHPGMSAFASHTDHGDQANFDGVHITIGWKGNFTEFHAEIQAGGQSFRADPNLVIDLPESEKKEYPEFKEWSSRVNKKTATQSSSFPLTQTSFNTSFNLTKVTEPVGCPRLTKYTVVTNFLTASDTDCPVCKETMSKEAKEMRRCRNCQVFIAYNGEEISDIIRNRKAINRPTYELEPDSAKRPIAFWRRHSLSSAHTTYIEPKGGDGDPKAQLALEVGDHPYL